MPAETERGRRARKLVLVSGWLAIAAIVLALPRVYPVQSPSQTSTTALREQGWQVFTAHCGKCHDADAAKKLPDGTTLLARLAAQETPEARLATRLKNMSAQDARGVTLYMRDLITKFRAAQKNSSQE